MDTFIPGPHHLSATFKSSFTVHQRSNNIGGLPYYPPNETMQERLARCIEHELYYGGNHKAAAAAIVRDIREGYIQFSDVLDGVKAERDLAIRMLAKWCTSVDLKGSDWDAWDEHYKNAAHRPGPLRELLDAAIVEVKTHESL